MGEFKDEGSPDIVLIEELSEAIKVIAKKIRVNADWHSIPPGKDTTRWEMLKAEMNDVKIQWKRLKKEVNKK